MALDLFEDVERKGELGRPQVSVPPARSVGSARHSAPCVWLRGACTAYGLLRGGRGRASGGASGEERLVARRTPFEAAVVPEENCMQSDVRVERGREGARVERGDAAEGVEDRNDSERARTARRGRRRKRRGRSRAEPGIPATSASVMPTSSGAYAAPSRAAASSATRNAGPSRADANTTSPARPPRREAGPESLGAPEQFRVGQVTSSVTTAR